MKYRFAAYIIAGIGLLASAPVALAEPAAVLRGETSEVRDTYYRAKVISVEDEKSATEYGEEQITQKVKVRLTSGDVSGREMIITYDSKGGVNGARKLSENQPVVVVRTETPEGLNYFITEPYRLPAILGIAALFFALILVFAGKRGLMSFMGLGFTILIMALFIIPQIAQGGNPFLISFVGTIFIASSSLFLAHGLNKRTVIAFIGTLVSIGIALVVATICVRLAGLTGLGTEEAAYLQFAPVGTINLRGLLLGGIIIGVLGVLDDITTAQAAAVYEIHRANPSFDWHELYRRGSSVGKEHITSLVNTLVLAYAGASFPLLLLFTIYPTPFWVTLNTELMSEEVIRTLVGSIVLVVAVPLTTALAASVFSRERKI